MKLESDDFAFSFFLITKIISDSFNNRFIVAAKMKIIYGDAEMERKLLRNIHLCTKSYQDLSVMSVVNWVVMV